MSVPKRWILPSGSRLSASRCRVATLTLVALCASSLGAQTDQFLSAPMGKLACRIVAPTRADSASHVIEYGDIVPGVDSTVQKMSRSLRAAYDSAGTPLYLKLTAIVDTSEVTPRGYLYAVRFVPFVRGVKFTIARGEISSSSDTSQSAPSVRRTPRYDALSDADLAGARALVEWLWSHRCAAAEH